MKDIGQVVENLEWYRQHYRDQKVLNGYSRERI